MHNAAELNKNHNSSIAQTQAPVKLSYTFQSILFKYIRNKAAKGKHISLEGNKMVGTCLTTNGQTTLIKLSMAH